MGIVNPFPVPYFPGQPYGQEGVQVDPAEDIAFAEKQVKKEPGVVFCLKAEAPGKEAVQPLLTVRLFRERGRTFFAATHQQHLIPSRRQGGSDPGHALVEAEVVGYRKYDAFQWFRLSFG